MRWPGLLTALVGLTAGVSVIALLPERTLFAPNPTYAETDSGAGERWACPMMDFIGRKAGDCPVCGMKMQKVTSGELTREQQRRMGLDLARITEGPAHATVRAYGAVRYDDRTAQVVIARVAGRIVKRHPATLHAGTIVKAGEPIVDLYSAEAFAAQAELAAAVKLGDQTVIRALTQRFERLNLGSVAKAILAGGTPVDTITISSPSEGRVVLANSGETDAMTAKLPQVGQEIAADTPLLRLLEPHAFMLVIYVPETRSRWVRVGQPVRLASDDFGDLPEVEAKIAWVSPELSADTRAREVHVHLRDPKERLFPGSLVSTQIQATLGPDLKIADPDKPETWGRFALVPKTAVLSTGVRHVVWRVADKDKNGRLRFELAPLALGPRLEDEMGNDLYVVRSGLRPGDEVATQGVFLIDSQAQLAGTSSLLFPKGAVASPAPHQH